MDLPWISNIGSAFRASAIESLSIIPVADNDCDIRGGRVGNTDIFGYFRIVGFLLATEFAIFSWQFSSLTENNGGACGIVSLLFVQRLRDCGSV